MFDILAWAYKKANNTVDKCKGRQKSSGQSYNYVGIPVSSLVNLNHLAVTYTL